MSAPRLDVLAQNAIKAMQGIPGQSAARQSREIDRAIARIQQELRGSIQSMAHQNRVQNFSEEVTQHAYMAIFRSLKTWQPEIATFSTHVHWQLRGEMKAINHAFHQDHRIIQTKTPTHKLPVPSRTFSMDAAMSTSEENNEVFTGHDFYASQYAEKEIHVKTEEFVLQRQLDRAISHIFGAKEARRSDASEAAIIENRFKLMERREMYLRHFLGEETFDEIGRQFGRTRERIRQVVRSLESELQRIMVLENGTFRHSDFHPTWDAFVASYFVKHKDNHLNENSPYRPAGVAIEMPAFYASDSAGLHPVFDEDVEVATVEAIEAPENTNENWNTNEAILMENFREERQYVMHFHAEHGLAA